MTSWAPSQPFEFAGRHRHLPVATQTFSDAHASSEVAPAHAEPIQPGQFTGIHGDNHDLHPEGR